MRNIFYILALFKHIPIALWTVIQMPLHSFVSPSGVFVFRTYNEPQQKNSTCFDLFIETKTLNPHTIFSKSLDLVWSLKLNIVGPG